MGGVSFHGAVVAAVMFFFPLFPQIFLAFHEVSVELTANPERQAALEEQEGDLAGAHAL
jgi:hypothetical protein